MAYCRTSAAIEALNYAGGSGGVIMSNGAGTISCTLNPTLTSLIINGGGNSLNVSGGNLIVAGTSTLTGNVTVGSASGGDALIGTHNTGANNLAFSFVNTGGTSYLGLESSSGGHYITGSSDYAMIMRSANAINFSTGGGTLALTLDTSQNATFAGNITISTGAYSTTCASGGTAFLAYGRSSDNVSQMLFYSNNGSTLYAQIQATSTSSGTLGLVAGGTTAISMTSSTTVISGILGIGSATSSNAPIYVNATNTASNMTFIWNASTWAPVANSGVCYGYYSQPAVTIGAYTGMSWYGMYLNTPSGGGPSGSSGGSINLCQLFIASCGTSATVSIGTAYGIYQGGTDQNFLTGPLTVGGTFIAQNLASLSVLRLGNAYVGGALTATGYVTLQDASGTTYKVLVHT